jgi:transcriptional regulator with XRE-family HTH domain
MKTLGQKIRELREERDLSLRDLAKRLGVTAAFLSDIELGRRYPSDKVLSDMAKALGTSLENLRSHDTRAPVEDLKRLASSNPLYGIAFRKVVDKAVSKKISPKELMEFAEKKSTKKKS